MKTLNEVYETLLTDRERQWFNTIKRQNKDILLVAIQKPEWNEKFAKFVVKMAKHHDDMSTRSW